MESPFPQAQAASGLTSPVAIADGGTGQTTAADARTALGLGTAATNATGDFATAAQGALAATAVQPAALGTAAALNVGTAANQVVQLNASAELPAVSGANLTNLPAAGFAPGYAYLQKTADGTWTPYATLTLAKAAASSGDTIVVGAGTYNENNLLKNGVNWYFMPGAKVTYTSGGTADCAIFDNGANGANGTVVCSIGGFGQFTNTISDSASAGILNIGKLATITFNADSMSSNKSCIRMYDGAWSSKLYADVKTITTTGSAATVILTEGDSMYVTADLIVNSGGASAIQSTSDDSGSGKMIVHAKRITSTNIAVNVVNEGWLHITVDGDIVSTGGAAVQHDSKRSVFIQAARLIGTGGTLNLTSNMGSTSEITVRAMEISATSTNAVTFAASAGQATVDCPSIKTSAASYFAVKASSTGTLRLINARVRNTGTNGVAMELSGGAVVQAIGACAFISDAGATDSVTAGTAQNLTAIGFVCGNKAKNANVTLLVGTEVWSDANVT